MKTYTCMIQDLSTFLNAWDQLSSEERIFDETLNSDNIRNLSPNQSESKY